MSDSTLRKRDTGWKRDGRVRGVYWRRLAKGKGWGYYSAGRIHAAPSRQAALDGRAEAQLRRSKGLPEPDTRITISKLAEEVREQKRGKLRGSSFRAFEYALDSVLLPELGHLRVVQVGPDQLARLVRDLERRELAAPSIRRYLSPLGPIFKLAIRRGIVPVSPLALLSDDERPSGGGVREHYVWSPEEIARLVEAAEQLGHREVAQYDYAPLIRLLVLTGLRVSEALALRWQDVDLERGTITVVRSLRGADTGGPKSKTSRRSVVLFDETIDALRAHRTRQVEERLLAGTMWQDGDLVFPNEFGAFQSPQRLRDRLKAILDRSGLPRIRFHDLRHSAATNWLKGDMHPKVASERLGHASVAITLDLYSHVTATMQREAVEAITRKRTAKRDLLGEPR